MVAGQLFFSPSPRLMISTRKICEDLKQFCLSNCCVVFFSAVPVMCTDLGKQADWMGVKAYASRTLTGVTWKGAVNAQGWPLPAFDV